MFPKYNLFKLDTKQVHIFSNTLEFKFMVGLGDIVYADSSKSFYIVRKSQIYDIGFTYFPRKALPKWVEVEMLLYS